jgi:hypothetical protein
MCHQLSQRHYQRRFERFQLTHNAHPLHLVFWKKKKDLLQRGLRSLYMYCNRYNDVTRKKPHVTSLNLTTPSSLRWEKGSMYEIEACAHGPMRKL